MRTKYKKQKENNHGLITAELVLVFSIMGVSMVITGCGMRENNSIEGISTNETASDITEVVTEEAFSYEDVYEPEKGDNQESVDVEENIEEETHVLSEDEIYDAIVNYCKIENPNLETMSASEHQYYWSTESVTDNDIVILYRSYTSARIYYHVNPITGFVYTMESNTPEHELDEGFGHEVFNIFDYLPSDTETLQSTSEYIYLYCEDVKNCQIENNSLVIESDFYLSGTDRNSNVEKEGDVPTYKISNDCLCMKVYGGGVPEKISFDEACDRIASGVEGNGTEVFIRNNEIICILTWYS